MLFQDKDALVTKTLEWEELSLKEQRALLDAGYHPSVGVILRNNLDINGEYL